MQIWMRSNGVHRRVVVDATGAWSRRHRFVGHVVQGRYRTEPVEDQTYLWTVTRCVHLNPARAGLAGVLGVSRPDRVPNLTRRFAGWLADRKAVRERLKRLEPELQQVASREYT